MLYKGIIYTQPAAVAFGYIRSKGWNNKLWRFRATAQEDATFKAGVRVVICSDSCHSGTVDRGDPPDDDLPAAKQLPMSVAIATEKAHQAEYDELQKKVPKERLAAMAATVVLLSGCQDHQFSRDGRVNGAFTGALLKAWKEPSARKSLQSLLTATAAGIPNDYDQVPNFTVIGFDIGPALTI